ncbi:ATP-binding protein [Nonomuraea angiospora]
MSGHPGGRGGPDPGAAATVQEFVAQLRLLKVWAGSPSFERLARACGVPRSTLVDALSPRRRQLPRLDVVRPFVLACGADEAALARWESAWRWLQADLDGARAFDGQDLAWSAPTWGLPAQLPLDTSAFVGRDAELAQLDALLAGTAEHTSATAIMVLLGTAGVGKTALAVRWAHRIRDRFQDGQLYVNLRGFDLAEPALAPEEAVRGFLNALGVPPRQIPAGLDARISLYRSLLAERHVLIVLDNAAGAEQVRPLLPGAPGCLVVVTSRNRLSGLVAVEGAHPITLRLLSGAEARLMLARRLGPARVAAERPAVDEIIDRCAGLPLALAVAASGAALHPDLPIAALADRLREDVRGLDMFAGSDSAADLRAVFSSSYHALSPAARRLFRLLSCHPGPDLGVQAAASLAGLPRGRARPLLAEMAGGHVTMEDVPGRYAVHGLLRGYATELADSEETPGGRRDALRRVLDHYVHSAHAADRLLDPYRSTIDLPAPPAGVSPEQPTDGKGALAWFDAEYPVLRRAVEKGGQEGMDRQVWHLGWALTTYQRRHGAWQDQSAVQALALAAARNRADQGWEAYSHLCLGQAATRRGLFMEAATHLRHALGLYAETGDLRGQADTCLASTAALREQGRHEDALHQAQRALTLYQQAGDEAGQAGAFTGIGLAYTAQGRYDDALLYLEQGLVRQRDLGNRDGQASAWHGLGRAHNAMRDHQQAVACLLHALSLHRDLGDHYHEAAALAALGDVYWTVGDRDSAHDAWLESLTVLPGLERKTADRVRAKLVSLGR